MYQYKPVMVQPYGKTYSNSKCDFLAFNLQVHLCRSDFLH